ncbi:MAG: hypothetical protein ABTQ34_04315 [Bdellovibrionales bacterium]
MISLNPVKLFKIGVGAILATVVVYSATVIGSPWEQRKRLIDQSVRADMALIVEKLRIYNNEKKMAGLPASLEELECKTYEWSGANRREGVKGCAAQDITYERQSEDTYRLCATFLLPGPRVRQESRVATRYLHSEFEVKELTPLIGHPAGPFCVTVKVEPERVPQ